MDYDTNTTQGRLAHRDRRDRVVMLYEVETYGMQVKKEIPFVVGVLSDLWGHSRTGDQMADGRERRGLRERTWTEIDRDNFETVMSKMAPELRLKVKSHLSGPEDRDITVDLMFKGLADFEPAAVARAVPALRNLLELRERLQEADVAGDISPKLADLLEEVLRDPDRLNNLAHDLNASPSGVGDEGKTEP